jgi:hypothetical protein
MAADKPRPTWADYVTIVLGPALIIAMIVSLVFFLLAVLYRGEYASRLHYILFFFTFGMVLVARISMEGGISARAPLYGGVLGFVAWLGMGKFVDYPPELAASSWFINAALIGLAWWLSYQLTYSCTYIDEKAENTGTGVLQAAGLEEGSGTERTDRVSGVSTTGDRSQAEFGNESGDETGGVGKRDKKRSSKLTWWQRFERFRAERKKTQPPGVWVVYFALAALPIFGLGQALIDVADVERRTYTFWVMTLYVGSSLGLLVTTAFLGLRRYLRQRRLEMPKVVTAAWLVLGAVSVVTFLIIGAALPRPQAEFWALSLARAGSKDVAASKRAVLQNDPGKGEGRPGRQEHDPKGERQADKGARGQGKDGKGQAKGDGSRDGPKGGANDSSKKAGENTDAKGTQKDAANDAAKKGQNPDAKTGNEQKDGERRDAEPNQKQDAADNSSGGSWLDWLSKATTVLKWIVFAILALVVAVFVLRGGLRYLANFTDWARRLLNALRGFWERLFGGGKSVTPSNDRSAANSRARRLPFEAYANPFHNGRAEEMTAAELVRYSFEALEAWAAERDCGRSAQETPLEFTNRLADEVGLLGQEAQQLGILYARVLYARGALLADWRGALEEFWQKLEAEVTVSG